VVEAATVIVPNFSAIHAPYIVRRKMSRASASVPKYISVSEAGPPAQPGAVRSGNPPSREEVNALRS